MEQLKWKDAFRTSQALLIFCEVWILDKKRTWKTNIKAIFFAVTTIVFDITLLMEMHLLFKRKDYEAISVHLSTSSLYVGFTIKIIMFMNKTKELQNLIDLVDWPGLDDFPEVFQENKRKSIISSNVISRFYFITVSFNIILYLNRPLYSSYFKYPIDFSYPLPKWGEYCLIILQVFCVYYIILVGIALDLLHASLARTATKLLDILCNTITSFKPTNKKNPEADELEFLRKCAIKHWHIIRMVDASESVFSALLLLQYIVSIISICNGVFQLTHTDSSATLSVVCNSLFVFNVLFEIAVFCWFAGLFTAKSVELSTAYYMYDWINSSESVKKSLLILTHRSQQPIYMTAGTVVRLSMASFLQVIKAAYSYFTLMQNLYNKSI